MRAEVQAMGWEHAQKAATLVAAALHATAAAAAAAGGGGGGSRLCLRHFRDDYVTSDISFHVHCIPWMLLVISMHFLYRKSV